MTEIVRVGVHDDEAAQHEEELDPHMPGEEKAAQRLVPEKSRFLRNERRVMQNDQDRGHETAKL
ncbi:hypothetical protein M2351_007566 [Azospirillum canadense]|nr:hypothetical protein [Azospirillum canadense]